MSQTAKVVPPPVPVPATGDAQPVTAVPTDPRLLPPANLAPIWPLGTMLDMHCAVSTSSYDPYAPQVLQTDADLPRFTWSDIRYGDWKDERSKDFDVAVPAVSIRRSK